jgi:hypothetical protein
MMNTTMTPPATTTTTTPPPASTGGSVVPPGPSESCGISITVEKGKIPSVGVAKITGLAAGATDAVVEFGKDAMYGMKAPLDQKYLDKTYLLGMESGGMYHYRVSAKVDGKTCATADATFAAGALDTSVTSGLKITGTGSPGFLVSSQYQGKQFAFILNETGKPVWAFSSSSVSQPTRARMSYDGRYMWIIKANVPNSSASVHRVSMDGAEDTDFTSQFTGANHDLAVLPDEKVAFFAYGKSASGKSCDDIKIFDPATKMATKIANIGDLDGAAADCHTNAIQYSPEDKTLVASDLNDNSFNKFTLTGEKVWTFGGGKSDFTGTKWVRQHNFHVLSKDKILFFNNGATGNGSPSLAQEVTVDAAAKTWTLGWKYASSPAIDNDVMGDAQRLQNGNTVVTFSVAGKIHEVDKDGKVVQSIEASSVQFGYSEKRESLYGAPPR